MNDQLNHLGDNYLRMWTMVIYRILNKDNITEAERTNLWKEVYNAQLKAIMDFAVKHDLDLCDMVSKDER